MLPQKIQRLVQLLARLPGVGEKTAQRFALHLVAIDPDLATKLSVDLADLRQRIRPCEQCNNLAEVSVDGTSVCGVCRDPKRDASLLCVVAKIQDLLAIERSHAMRGRYFVLGRLLSPLDGIGPDELPLDELFERLRQGVAEVILATPPSVDGEATALLLARELRERGVKVSRIASGIPHGGELEYADQITLGRAIDGRLVVDEPGAKAP